MKPGRNLKVPISNFNQTLGDERTVTMDSERVIKEHAGLQVVE